MGEAAEAAVAVSEIKTALPLVSLVDVPSSVLVSLGATTYKQTTLTARIQYGVTLIDYGVTLRELSSNPSEAVYQVSIARQPPPGGVVSAWLDARPRLGREAKLLMKIRRAAGAPQPLLLKDLATLPRRAPDGFAPGATPPGAVRRDLWIGTDYAGPILTINALKAGVNLQIRAVSLDAKLSLSDAASDGGRVLALTAALPVLGESADTGAFYRSQPDEAAWALLGISADGGAEITLALAAHPLPPRSIDVAVPDEVPGRGAGRRLDGQRTPLCDSSRSCFSTPRSSWLNSPTRTTPTPCASPARAALSPPAPDWAPSWNA